MLAGLYWSQMDELKFYIKYDSRSTQPAITRSKLTIETQEQGVKYVQS